MSGKCSRIFPAIWRRVKFRRSSPHVEDFAGDILHGCVERLDDRLRNVVDVNEGAPLLAVVNGDDAFLASLGGEQVDDEVETRSGSETEDSGEAQNDRNGRIPLRASSKTFSESIFRPATIE